MTLIMVIRQAFRSPDGENDGAKTASVPEPLITPGRGANLPYFCKQGMK